MISFKITDTPDQRFSTVINNRRITLRLWFSVFNQRWSMDLSIDNEPVIHGRKVVEGVDLIEPFNFGIGSIFAYSENSVEPDKQALVGGSLKLYHASESEVNATVVT